MKKHLFHILLKSIKSDIKRKLRLLFIISYILISTHANNKSKIVGRQVTLPDTPCKASYGQWLVFGPKSRI